MARLARSPAPRPREVDPRQLIRCAPLVARMARLQVRERRLFGVTVCLEVAAFAGAAVVVRDALAGGLLRGVWELSFDGSHGVPGLLVVLAAVLLAGWTTGLVSAR